MKIDIKKHSSHFGNIILTVSTFIFLFIIIELILPFFDERGPSIWQKDHLIDQIEIEEKQISKFIESTVFDSELGWDYPEVISSNNINYIAQSYGDSFTKSSKINSWQEQFYDLSGLGILNLGVWAYGVDQAVLKSEKLSFTFKQKFNTPILILGLYGEMYRRSLSYHVYNYFTNTPDFKYVFKPMFFYENGNYKLLKPPCLNVDCLKHELIKPFSQTYKNLAKYDHWYKKEKLKPKLEFPRSYSYIKAIPDIIHLKKRRAYLEPYDFVDDESIELIRYLLSRFIKEAEKQKSKPVVLFMYDVFHLNGMMKNKREDNWVLKFLEESNVLYIDTSALFIDYYNDNGNIKDLFKPDGHYNQKGDSLVAIAILQSLESEIISYKKKM